jgi:GH43 family beta-xylosidase
MDRPIVLPRSRRLRTVLAATVTGVVVAALLPVLLAGPASAAVTFTSTAVNQASSRCMTVPGGASTSALQLTQATCSAAGQQFTFTPTSATSDVYTITTGAGLCIDVSGNSTADNATVIQYACHSGNNQRYRLQPVTISGATFTFNLVATHSNKCIVPAGSSTADNVGLVQLPCSTATVRVWRLPSFNPGPTTPPTSTPPPSGRTFTNPIRTQGPDPFMVHYNGFYYLVTTTWNNTITMRRSATLGGIATTPNTVVYNLSSQPNGCCNMWAPELHLLTGPNGTRWYLYYTASQNVSNYLPTQRIHVLESAGLDPMGPYTFRGDLLDPTQNNTWELDGSILQLGGQLYLLGTFYNGSQPMFIRPMSNPWTASGTRRILSTPTLSWETVGGAVNEGPEVLQRNGQTFIVFSASHCSTPDYKMGLLRYNGGDPLNSSSWVKSPNPIFVRNNAASVYGPGHGNFFKSPDGTEDWMVYHANSSTSQGCDINRTTRAQKISWNADGTPNLGVPVALGTPLAVPSGEPAPPNPTGNLALSASASCSFTSAWESCAAINNGDEPSSSNIPGPNQGTRWGTWPNSGQQWAELTWSSSVSTNRAQVYFFDDGGGIDMPSSWSLQYWNGSSYVNVPGASAYTRNANAYNTVTFTTVTTTRLRVVLNSTGTSSVGLLEVKAFAP